MIYLCTALTFASLISYLYFTDSGEDAMSTISGLVFIAFIFGWGWYFGSELTKDGSYKQGQIDALSGKVKYKLEKQQDSSIQWVEIKKPNK